MTPFQVSGRMVIQEVPSWNQVRDWLRQLEDLRAAALEAPFGDSEES